MAGPWTDAHCHLADPRLAGRLDEIVRRSRAAGVVGWVQGGVCPDDWQRQRALQARLGPSVRVAFGLHPWWTAAASDAEIDGALAALEAQVSDADALGEIGIDNHPRWRTGDALERQQRALLTQLAIARRVPRPLVLHVVRAHHLVLPLLERHAPFPRGGLVHAFTGGLREARRYVQLGLHLSLGGALAARPERARALAAIPQDSILIETDAPDQAPRDWRVEVNEPAFLPRIAGSLAPVWDISGPHLLDRTHRSLQTLFAP